MRLFSENIEPLAVAADVVRRMDRRAIDEFGIPGAVLMENAGAAASEAALDMTSAGDRVAVFAGAGNNAGDGFVIARHLANAGRRVEVITAVAPGRYTGDAALYLGVISKMGLAVSCWDASKRMSVSGTGLIVDALLGTGLSGPLREPFGGMIDVINAAGARVLAIDIPSGLDADSGLIHTVAVKADATVTFALPKAGLFAGSGPALCGRVMLADIGMPAAVYPEGKSLAGL